MRYSVSFSCSPSFYFPDLCFRISVVLAESMMQHHRKTELKIGPSLIGLQLLEMYVC